MDMKWLMEPEEEKRNMRLLIPEIGTLLTLEEDWTFRLHHECRNEKLITQLALIDDPFLNRFPHFTEHSNRPRKYWEVTIGKGSGLKVDRIYIRKGASDYSSVTFNLHGGKGVNLVNPKLKPRFWVKLEDVNKMIIRDDR